MEMNAMGYAYKKVSITTTDGATMIGTVCNFIEPFEIDENNPEVGLIISLAENDRHCLIYPSEIKEISEIN
jgi:hypothetical protein